VRDRQEDLLLNGLDPEQGSFLVAGWAEEPGFACERDGHVLPARGAFVAGDSFPWVSAGQEPFNGVGDDGAKEAVVLGIDAMITLLKVAEMMIDDFEQRAFVE